MSTSQNLLRWIAVLPVGVVSAFLVAFPIHWIVMTTLGGWSMEPVIEIGNVDTLRKIEEVLQTAFGPLAFVYFGARTAPSYRVVTSVLLAGIIVLGLSIAIYLWNLSVVSSGDGFAFDNGTLRIVANIIGCSVAIYLIHFREQEES